MKSITFIFAIILLISTTNAACADHGGVDTCHADSCKWCSNICQTEDCDCDTRKDESVRWSLDCGSQDGCEFCWQGNYDCRPITEGCDCSIPTVWENCNLSTRCFMCAAVCEEGRCNCGNAQNESDCNENGNCLWCLDDNTCKDDQELCCSEKRDEECAASSDCNVCGALNCLKTDCQCPATADQATCDTLSTCNWCGSTCQSGACACADGNASVDVCDNYDGCNYCGNVCTTDTCTCDSSYDQVTCETYDGCNFCSTTCGTAACDCENGMDSLEACITYTGCNFCRNTCSTDFCDCTYGIDEENCAIYSSCNWCAADQQCQDPRAEGYVECAVEQNEIVQNDGEGEETGDGETTGNDDASGKIKIVSFALFVSLIVMIFMI